MQVPWAGQTHRYFWTVAEPIAMSSLPAWGVCSESNSGSDWGPPGSSHDQVLCFHRAARSYFSLATARLSQLNTCGPEVNFQKQVRTPGGGFPVMWPQTSAGEGTRVQAPGPL